MIEAHELIGQLPEIIDKLVAHFSVKDLSRAAAVNRSWNQAATRQLRKKGPQILVMPVSKIRKSIETKPFVTLCFVNRYMRKDDFIQSQNFFPNHLLVVPTKTVMMNGKQITGDSIEYHNCQSKNEIVSLLIPQYRDLEIRVAYDKDLPERQWNSRDDTLNQIFLNEFLPKDSQSKVTFIMFGHTSYEHTSLLDLLDKWMKERQQQYDIWGGALLETAFTKEEFNDPLYGFNTRNRGIFAMSITGSSLQSQSLVLHWNLGEHELDQKLQGWRSQLRFKQHRIGLICGPDTLTTYSHDIWILAVKRIFPNVPFIEIYDHIHSRFYGFKSKIDDPKQKLEHTSSFSLMILTYD